MASSCVETLAHSREHPHDNDVCGLVVSGKIDFVTPSGLGVDLKHDSFLFVFVSLVARR